MAFAVLIIVRSLVDQVAARMPAERQGGQSFLRLCLPLGTFPEVGVPLPEDPVEIDAIVELTTCIHTKNLQFS